MLCLRHWMAINLAMQTIAELPEYIRCPEKLLSPSERSDVVSYLAAHPKAGDLMEGAGGVRKLRWGRGSQGKSGGVRVIYYVQYWEECLGSCGIAKFCRMRVR